MSFDRAKSPGAPVKSASPRRNGGNPRSMPPPPAWQALAFRTAPRSIQTKLKVGAPGDAYEREADRVAEAVTRGGAAGPVSGAASGSNDGIQRMCSACAGDQEEDGHVQAKEESSRSPTLTPATEARISGLRGRGERLPGPVRAMFEPRFGRDFGDVNIHTGSAAAATARAIQAQAYTVGRDIVFDQGRFAPSTPEGQTLLAHELTHVVQQGAAGERVQRFATEDCEDPDVALIRKAFDRSIELLNKAIDRLTANPVTATTQTHFANHFGAWAEWRRDIVVDHFRKDLKLMVAENITYECESECDEGEPAYTYWIFGDIHICLPWLRSQVLNEKAETLIHELHHWDGARGHLDLGYHKNNKDAGTSWLVAVNNADSYSELAQDLFEQS